MAPVLSLRLQKALEMLSGLKRVADIGCDHGYLAAALLERQECRRVAACDISLPSLNKARALGEQRGLLNRMEFFHGSGLTMLSPGVWDGAAILGMGGELITSILEEGAAIAKSMERLVLQPMGGEKELRQYLYAHCYHVREDVIVQEGWRYYQLLSVSPGSEPDAWPEEFPENFFLVGYRSFEQKDPLLGAYCQKRIDQRNKRLLSAKGTPGEEKLLSEKENLEKVLRGLQL